MRQLRLVAVVLLAACAFGAVGAGAASGAVARITYSGNGAFTISSGATKFVTVGKLEVSCTGDLGTGRLGSSQATTAELTISFTGCTFLGKQCISSGGANGLIDTVKLLAKLGNINSTTVGVLLAPRSGTAWFVPVKCGTVTLELRGTVIGEIPSIENDIQTTGLPIKFKQTAGAQAITKFEGEVTTNIVELSSSGTFETAGFESEEHFVLTSGSGQLLP
jgi:hypothetical protein